MSSFRLPVILRHALTLCALLACGIAAAQEAAGTPFSTVRNWRQQDGLPTNEITALCLDRQGYLWIATSVGLTRFDGTRFLNHHYPAAGSARPSGFAAIVADATADSLWAAPFEGGLLRLERGRFTPQTLPAHYTNHRVARLFVAADRALWIAFEGGDVMRLLGDHHEIFGERDGLGPRRSTQLASDGRGRVWLANGAQLAFYADGSLHPVPLEGVTDQLRLASSRTDGPWILSRGWLRKIVDGKVGLKVEVNSGFNARSVQALVEDAQGAVWTGTRSRGVRRLTFPEEKSDLIFETPEDIGVLLEDREGNIWVGANGNGLIRIRPGMVRRFDKTQGLLESHTLGLCEDHAGTLWIANRDGGLAYLNEQGRARTLSAPKGRDTFSARSVAPLGPDGVLVTTSYGLKRATRHGFVAPDNPAAPPPPPSGHGEMRITHAARNGDFWTVLHPGVIGRLRDGQWRTFDARDGLKPGGVQAITEDAQGRLWVGTESSMLFYLEHERFIAVPTVAPVHVIHFDDTGTGWIGTDGAGLVRLDDPTGRTLTERHGLPSNNLTQVMSDHRGNLWFGSPQGIFQVTRLQLDQFFAGKIDRVDATQLRADEGVTEAIGASAHQPSAWRSRDGVLWFATRQGVVAIHPQQEKVTRTPLLTQLETVRTPEAQWPATNPITIPALSRTVELEYSILCLSTPDRVRARVRLEGYEEDWTTADARGVARYTRLPPGEYHFVVEAHLTGVPGSSSQLRVPIIVLAAWWQTLWFRLGVAAFALLLGVLAARAWSHRRLQARLAKLESESTLERERARIARNIHDDLGAGLTRISLLTQSAQRENDRAQLDKIYTTVSALTQSMDEIVWAVNPQHDDLESVANYIIAFAQSFLSDAGIRARVSLPDFLPRHILTAQHRHHLFLSCKEALHNVAKHAHATEVSLHLNVAGNELTIVIADNGHGFASPDATTPGRNGLANLRARLAELGGTCTINSTPAGTTLTFTAPLPPPPAL